MIALYPDCSQISLDIRPDLHPRFRTLKEGISEFTFANIYLFREKHNYGVSALSDGLVVICGRDGDAPFFMLPFGLPDEAVLRELFGRFGAMKAVSEPQAGQLAAIGYRVVEDRDNFDYLYCRQDLVNLTGRKFHKKKNLLNLFIRDNQCQARPLLEEYRDDALRVLDEWNRLNGGASDLAAAKEALEKMWPLQLCGGIFYIDEKPVAYCLGEELALGTSFVIHFEKAVVEPQFKGIYQFINQAFASILPEKYQVLNREQDLGDPGLRQAKESYQPAGFMKKYRAVAH
jgi:hypothetical protein